jgi:predicted transcriptional regulator
MDKQAFPVLDPDRWEVEEKDAGDGARGRPGVAEPTAPAESPDGVTTAISHRKNCEPISSMMQEDVQSIDAEDTIEKVELALAERGYTSIPVMGSNGAIVGVIGPVELNRFHAGQGNAKAVRAWEISRCTMFEVSPDGPADDVAKLLAENNLDYIAVTELGALKGYVSARTLEIALLNRTMAAPGDGDDSGEELARQAGRSRRADD